MEYKIREKLFGANRTSASGTSLTLNDTVKYPINKLTIDGVCEQDTTSGSNLCNLNVVQDSRVVYNSDGTITINGAGGFALKFSDYTFKANTTYYMKWELISGSVNQEQIFMAPDNTSFAKKDTFAPFKFDSDTVIRGLWIHGGALFTNAVIRIWFSETQNSFEPYTGGQPSPSPDYPQEIKTITGNLKLTSCGKNLIDKYNLKSGSYSRSTGQWVPYNSRYCTKEMIKVKPNTNYIINNNNKSSYNIKNIVDCYDINKKYIGRISRINGDDNKQSYIVPQNGMYFNITFNEISNTITKKIYEEYLENGIISPQLEQSNQATPYEPYQSTSLNITIPSNEFVGKLDDTYKDTLNVVYKDDGHYHLILNKMIGKIVLNGSETFYINAYAQTLGYNIFVYKGLTNSLANGDNSCKSNYFIHYSWGQFDSKDAIYQNSNWIMFKCDSLNIGNDIDKFKERLSTHNTEVYYPLAEPYEVDLGIVDTLLSYDKITNIFTNSDLLPIINVKYYNGSLDISNYEFSIKEDRYVMCL